ncbi:MAG: hypothetical protein ACLQI7_15815, partial [Streptosporangiaceae bacterium]
VRVEIIADGTLHPGHGAGLHPPAEQVQRYLSDPEGDRCEANGEQQPRSWWLIGPSMAALVSSGMTISVLAATIAAISMKIS